MVSEQLLDRYADVIKGAHNVTALRYDPLTELTRYTQGSADAWGEICSAGLSVTGITADGQEEPLLKNGEWGFEVGTPV